MPADEKHKFTAKEHRQAMRIKASLKRDGKDDEKAENLAWATINKRKYGFGRLKSK